MILTRTPLRISIAGGGTDLPSYYRRSGGSVVSAAIDKYVYLAVNDTFTEDYLLKYAEHERVDRPEEVRHPLIREVLLEHDVAPGIEIVSVADIPAGTGLGSSGAFTVGLLRALHASRREHVSTGVLAEEACRIEIERLGDPVGKQDQYIAAFGGLTQFDIDTDGSVEVSRLDVSGDTLADLEEHLLLFFTGYARRATSILADQRARSEQDDVAMLANLDEVGALGRQISDALARGATTEFGALMHEHWMQKRTRSTGITTGEIDAWYELARANGAVGGKLVGAGAGGFLLFYAENPRRVRSAMTDRGLAEVRFRFDHDGSVVLARQLMSLSCLVLAGGLATRMRPATDTVPKALLPVAGELFAVHQLRWLAGEGVERVVVSIGHLGSQIRTALGERNDLGVAVEFVDEGDRRLGTGGAVRLAVERGAVDDPFLVLYGDSWLKVDVAAVESAHRASGLEALMVVHRNEGRWDTSNAVFDDGLVLLYDKNEPDPRRAGMHHIDYGLSVLRCATVTERVPAGGPSDLADVFHALSLEGSLAGFEAVDRFFEIGSPAGWAELDRHLRQ